MSAPRFFCDAPLSAGARIALPEALAHHAIRVLRLRAGETVALFNGQGGEYPAVLEIEGKAGFAQLGAFDPREAELAGRITLVQGLPAGDKMTGWWKRPWSWAPPGSARSPRSAACCNWPAHDSKNGWPTGSASPSRPPNNAAAIA